MLVPKTRQQLGKQAEQMVLCYLQKQGFTIQAKNYRFQRAEIDLIAKKDDLLLFVETKIRNNTSFGYPESFVYPKQQSLYQLAATEYMQNNVWHGKVRFDVMAFYRKDKKLYLAHFKDAFF